MPQTRSKTGAVSVAPDYSEKKTRKQTSTATKRKAKDEGHVDDATGAMSPKHARHNKDVKKEHGAHSVPASKGANRADDKRLKSIASRIIDDFGSTPLQDLVFKEEHTGASGLPSSKVVMANVLNALLSSARISHEIAAKTFECLIEEGYHDLEKLHGSTWVGRTEVLTRGGYTRYREKTATGLGQLADFMRDEYDDDASNLLPAGQKGAEAREMLSSRLGKIKGLGPVGIDIFLGTIQHFYHAVAPFLDKRSRVTMEKVGLGEDLGAIFDALDTDAEKMARLEVALTKIRLEKQEGSVE